MGFQKIVSAKPPVDSSTTAYNREKYKHIVDWNQHTLLIDGQPTLIHSGEFHYWRVPDRSRWEAILQKYKMAGLNSIRIYFHWGFHSPRENYYVFDGNRDVDHLLTLCEKLELFVLAAPGPYICAETQAGGFPIWLVQMRDIRLRHSYSLMIRKYDEKFAMYSRQWYENILPIIAKHQITNSRGSKRGCVLALQIENEYFEYLKGFPVGLDDEMKQLAKSARDCGITVPLFTNDAFEAGSYIIPTSPDLRVQSKLWHRKKRYGLDLYGFDKYVVFAPGSDPLGNLLCNGNESTVWKDWDPITVTKSLDSIENTVRGFGNAAAKSPLFIPELQGGWFNHYCVREGFDQIYKFYGDGYTRMLVDSVADQGCHMWNLYMFYGGTTWGTLADPDVYVSYDYSAAVREFGFMSGRLRKLRLALFFYQTFSSASVDMQRVDPAHCTVTLPVSAVLNGVRRSINSRTEFIHFRHFNKLLMQKNPQNFFLINVNYASPQVSRDSLSTTGSARGTAATTSFSMSMILPYRQSFVALSKYKPATGPFLILSTLPIHARILSASGHELWIAQSDGEQSGEFAFAVEHDQLVIQGSMQTTVTSPCSGVSVVSFGLSTTIGWATFSIRSSTVPIDTADADIPRELRVIFLRQYDLHTFQLPLSHAHWKHSDQPSPTGSPLPHFGYWGVYGAFYDGARLELQFQRAPSENLLFLIGDAPLLTRDGGWRRLGGGSLVEDSLFRGCPNVFVIELPHVDATMLASVVLSSAFVLNSVDASAPITPLLQPLQNSPPSNPAAANARSSPFATFQWLNAEASACYGAGVQPSSTHLHHPESPSSIWWWKKSASKQWPWIELYPTSRHRFPLDPIDFAFTSGHSVYRADFTLKKTTRNEVDFSVELKLNVRHRCWILLNGKHVIGAHTTYSLNLLHPGSKTGPDFRSLGSRKYKIPSSLLEPFDDLPCAEASPYNVASTQLAESFMTVEKRSRNTLMIVVESLGLNRQAAVLNDVRNARGILSARLTVSHPQISWFSYFLASHVNIDSLQWFISGVDVRDREVAYDSSGIPDENLTSFFHDDQWNSVRATDSSPSPLTLLHIKASDGIQWFQGSFLATKKNGSSSVVDMPARLILRSVSQTARITAYVWVNDLLVCRFYSTEGPQTTFFLMDGLLKWRSENDDCGISNRVRIMLYAELDGALEMLLDGYRISMDDWSGNLSETDEPFTVFHGQVPLSFPPIL